MIYITGDTHGSVDHLKTHILPVAAGFQPDDLLIIAGDFGFLFAPEAPDPRFARMQAEAEAGIQLLHQLPCEIAFIDGNHENFPRIMGHPTQRWHGDLVHRITPRIVHLIRGSCYLIQGKRIVVLGGGLSIDRHRRTEGLTWWPEELPTLAEMHRFRTQFEREAPVDAVITHAAPLHVMRRLRYNPGAEGPLDTMLEEVYLAHRWKTWFFGHLHLDGDEGNGLYAMYQSIRTIDGKLIYHPHRPNL